MGTPDPAVDEITAEPPSSPSFREGASMWVWDDAGRFGFPRIGVEAVGKTWNTSFEIALCMAEPGGRLLLVTGDHPPHPVDDGDSRPRVLGAGPLSLRCVEPFVHWTLDFDGPVVVTDVERHLRGGIAKLTVDDGETAPLRLHVDARTVAPPWFQGTHAPEGVQVPGEHRHEQLCTVTGRVEVDGEATDFSGGALRVHRRGGDRNDDADFHGHVWQSAHFPSGRAFGSLHYRSGPDGAPRYREGWLLDGGEILPAKVEGTPWLTGTHPTGEDVSFTLRTTDGEVRIEGETFVSSLRPPRPTGSGASFPLLHSGIARYRWGDEEAFGMIERSARLGVTPD